MIKKITAFLLLLLPLYLFAGSRDVLNVEDIDNHSYYFIKSRCGNLVLDIKEASKKEHAPLVAYEKKGGHNQQFRMLGEGKYKQIVARHSGFVLDVMGGNKDNRVPIIQYHPHSGLNQLFKLVPADKGYFYIVAKHSKKVLQVERNESGNDGPIVQAERCENKKSQLFKLVRVVHDDDDDEEGNGDVPGEHEDDDDNDAGTAVE